MKGICFIQEMHHAVIDGSKIQTRRIINPQPTGYVQEYIERRRGGTLYLQFNFTCGTSVIARHHPGEKVYIKEPYQFTSSNKIEYKYDYLNIPISPIIQHWENKLYMPVKYARHFIQITGVWCERLQDIDDVGIVCEGVSDRIAFAKIINKINGKNTWENNPYVFVYEFIRYMNLSGK